MTTEIRYEEVELERVLRFYANHFEGKELQRLPTGGVWYEAIVDQARGIVLFKLMTTGPGDSND